jgi:hypothetical protein
MRIARIVLAASQRSLFSLLRRSAPAFLRYAGPSPAGSLTSFDDGVETVLGDRRLTMTPAQAAAFATRSFAWRCVSCGKVHAFDRPVRVGAASPCSCLQIEFETEIRRRPSGFAAFATLSEG